jgi:putative acetyltransferase
MNVNIRPVKIEDAPYLNKIRTMDGVRENILGITSERLAEAEARIRNFTAFLYISRELYLHIS